MAVEVTDLCRMCLTDLSQFPEYYAIDQELQSLVYALTAIQVDVSDNTLPLGMCPACARILNKFNNVKSTWVENQHQLELLAVKAEVNEQEQESIEYLQDESQDECEYQAEHVNDALEFEEPHFESQLETHEPYQPVKKENVEEAKKPRAITKPNTRPRPNKKITESKAKGKNIYQSLLIQCTECSKLIEKNRMEGHMNKHNNLRPFTCDVCGKDFYCKLLMRLHRNSIHTGQSVTCDVCSATFPSERSLYAHKLRHLNQNRYECNYCERKFNNSNSLKRHLAIHSGIREFSCEFCQSSFYRKFNLDVHIRTVHEKEKSYCCGFCPKKFGYARLLRDHMQRNHQDAAT